MSDQFADGGGMAPGSRVRKSKKQNWELNPQDVVRHCPIGTGSTSTVYRGSYAGQDIAIKEINEVDNGTLLAVRRELQVMTRTDHPNVLKFIGLISREPPLRLCLEYCAGGTLFDLLHNHWQVVVSWPQRLKMLMDIASAMAYLHGFRKQIIHRDLKSLNIFLVDAVLDESCMPNMKIADFGFARMRETIQDGTSRGKDWPTLTRGAGSMHWMAPEIYAGNHYDEKADTFSFAIVMYEISTRHMAFEDLEPDMAADEIQSGQRPDVSKPDPMPAEAPEEVVQLMQQCWNQHSSLRPSFPEILCSLSRIQAMYS